MTTFVGVDLGWEGKPSGLASLAMDGTALKLQKVDRLAGTDEIISWIVREAGSGTSVVGVDAPLVIQNPTGNRPAERELNKRFSRFHAGCYPANLGRRFAEHVRGFSHTLASLEFGHGAEIDPREPGKFQIEVHPHAATVNLFDLPQIVKYKKGRRQKRGSELRRLRELMLARMPLLDPALSPMLPEVPETGALKPTEDKIDAVLCAYIAAHWWFWARARNCVYGTEETGYIVVPEKPIAGNR